VSRPLVELGPPLRARLGRLRLVGLTPYVLLAALELVYVEKQAGAFTRSAIGFTVAGGLCLAFAAAGQTIVVMTGGIDLSVGGVISTATVLAATQYHASTGSIVLWTVLIVLIGAGAGALNALILVRLNLQPFIVTLATWSLWSGIAFWILPVEGGVIPQKLLDWVNANPAGFAVPIWILALGLLLWLLVRRSPLLYRIRAIGSNRDAAYLSGVNVPLTLVAAYASSGACAAVGGLFLATQISSGSPNIGDDFILQSAAAVVIGGTSLLGGNGSVAAAVAGSFVLTVAGSVVFALGFSSQLEAVIRALILIAAIVAVSAGTLIKRRRQGRIA
jgi:ribose transport system permease protein